jgi:hypothetical protein
MKDVERLHREAIALVEQTLERLPEETNTAAAKWLMRQLQAVN